MADLIKNSKEDSDILCFYIPEDKKENAPKTRIFLKRKGELYSKLIDILKKAGAEHLLESGTEFYEKLKNKSGYEFLKDSSIIKFDFNDINLLYNTIKLHVDQECDQKLQKLTNEARPFSSKRHDYLNHPLFEEGMISMIKANLNWYNSLKLSNQVTPDERTGLLQYKAAVDTIGKNNPQMAADLEAKIKSLREKYPASSDPESTSKINVTF